MTEQGIVFSSLNDIPESRLERLTKKRIYFGHMSVGYNIIDGINDLTKENNKLKINIIETNDPSRMASPVFAHSKIGKNMDPKSKIDQFVQSVEGGLGEKTNIAFFKLCFVDIESSTDDVELFNYYKSTMENLKNKYPRVAFIHVTVPLTTVQTGWKVSLKRIFGRPIGGYKDNIKRNQFNDLIRKEYAGKEQIFDLAAIEASARDGSITSFTHNDKAYFSLAPLYTDDGGH